MPDHDSAALLTRQTKRRRVDIGVKRTVGSVIFARNRETLLERFNQSHGMDQDGDCPLVGHSPAVAANGDGEKSNVLRKLLKRANSYEDSMMPFPGATIISQLLKSNMGKNGGSDSGFQVLNRKILFFDHFDISLARWQIKESFSLPTGEREPVQRWLGDPGRGRLQQLFPGKGQPLRLPFSGASPSSTSLLFLLFILLQEAAAARFACSFTAALPFILRP